MRGNFPMHDKNTETPVNILPEKFHSTFAGDAFRIPDEGYGNSLVRWALTKRVGFENSSLEEIAEFYNHFMGFETFFEEKFSALNSEFGIGRHLDKDSSAEERKIWSENHRVAEKSAHDEFRENYERISNRWGDK